MRYDDYIATGTADGLIPKTSFTVAVTTYKKNAALDVWLKTFRETMDDSLIENVVICDDAGPNAWEMFIKHGPSYEGRLHYIGGENLGIAKNKNRGIRFFKEHTKSHYLLLSDDDIQFVGSGLEKAFLKTGWGHVNTYLGVPGVEAEGNLPHFIEFPNQAIDYDKGLTWATGAQGIMLYFHRKVIDAVGYLDTDWKGRYGYEHAVYSARINKKFSYDPMYYARLRYCEEYFITQEVANAYEAKPEQNHKQYIDKMNDIRIGLGLVKERHGIDRFYPIKYD